MTPPFSLSPLPSRHRRRRRPLRGLLRLLVLLLTACRTVGDSDGDGALRYASLLRIQEGDSCTVVDIAADGASPQAAARYVLVPRTQPLPHALPQGTLLRTPLRRVAATSSVHAALLCDLQADSLLVGLCDTAYVLHPTLRTALRSGRLADLGASFAPDVERLLTTRPEVLLASPMDGSATAAITAAGIPTLLCTDYLETSALGRAEWMKLFGRLVGGEARADSLFDAVATRYDSMATLTLQVAERPHLLIDAPQGDTWYVPGGHSYLGRLYADAGADYLFAERRESGSVALAPEVVLTAAAEADLWLVKYGRATDLSYDDLAADAPLCRRLRPWQQRRVYGCNTLRVPYFEEVPFHPDRLLADLLHLFHPTLLPHHRLRYFTPLR
jgi:iron complex transport system substrate-binding protein